MVIIDFTAIYWSKHFLPEIPGEFSVPIEWAAEIPMNLAADSRAIKKKIPKCIDLLETIYHIIYIITIM